MVYSQNCSPLPSYIFCFTYSPPSKIDVRGQWNVHILANGGTEQFVRYIKTLYIENTCVFTILLFLVLYQDN